MSSTKQKGIDWDAALSEHAARSNYDIARLLGVDVSTVRRARNVRGLTSPKARVGNHVPDGFRVSRVNQTEDGDGNLLRQTVRSEPEGEDLEAVPEGWGIRRITAYQDAEGRVTQRWVRAEPPARDPIAALREAVSEAMEPYRGIVEPRAAPVIDRSHDLCCQLLWGDPHFGMYAWAEECGESYDLDIARRVHLGASRYLIDAAPAGDLGVLVTIGDTSHADDTTSRTPASGHPLDTDRRWRKVLRIIIATLRETAEMMLEKFERVEIKVVPGNHDPHTAVAISIALGLAFEREPRVNVDESADPFLWLRWGQCLFAYNHSDKCKMDALPMIMAVDRSKDWGECAFRHGYVGHIHHKRETVSRGREFVGCTVESLNTVAGRDSWHHSMGYRAAQRMKLDVWHKSTGRAAQFEVTPGKLEGLLSPDTESAA